MSALIEALSLGLEPYLDIPFAIFGHSMGGLVGFELARKFRRQQYPMPILLFVSSHPAPSVRRPPTRIHQLVDSELVTALRSLRGTSDELLRDRELMELVLPIIRADFEICETYEYLRDEPLDCPISAAGGEADPGVVREDLVTWASETRGQFSLRMFPGGHFYTESCKTEVLRSIRDDLIDVLRNS